MRSSCGSASRSKRNTLIATSRPLNGSRARYTELVAPLPISRRSGYFPSCSCNSNFTSVDRGFEERRDLLQQLGLLVGLAEELVDAERGGLAAMLLGVRDEIMMIGMSLVRGSPRTFRVRSKPSMRGI